MSKVDIRSALAKAAIIGGLAIAGAVGVASPAQAAVVGGVNVQNYCNATRPAYANWGTSAVTLGAGPYDWRCQDVLFDGVFKRYFYRGVDMNYACRLSYGPSSWASLQYSSRYGWVCNR